MLQKMYNKKKNNNIMFKENKAPEWNNIWCWMMVSSKWRQMLLLLLSTEMLVTPLHVMEIVIIDEAHSPMDWKSFMFIKNRWALSTTDFVGNNLIFWFFNF